jgi:hypothetical protein
LHPSRSDEFLRLLYLGALLWDTPWLLVRLWQPPPHWVRTSRESRGRDHQQTLSSRPAASRCCCAGAASPGVSLSCTGRQSRTQQVVMHAVRVLQQLLFLFTTLQLYVPFGLADHPGDTQEVGDECSMRSFDQLVPGVVTRMCPPPDSPTGCADGTPFTFLVRRGSDPTSAKKIIESMTTASKWRSARPYSGSCSSLAPLQLL